MEKLLYDKKSAAYALSISVRAIDYLIQNKLLETRRIGRKTLIPAGSLKLFAQQNHTSRLNTRIK